MNLVGVMIFWDESPHWLSACVSGFARVCDSIVAVDGAYSLLPGGRSRSHPDQAYAIQDACEAASIGCIIHRPSEVWRGNEVAKRNHSLRLAAALEPDWVMIFDSDYLVIKLDDPKGCRDLLSRSEANVCTYTSLNQSDHMTDAFMAERVISESVDHEWTDRERTIFRWTDDLRYGPAHYVIQGTYGGENHWLRGPDTDPSARFQASDPDHMLGLLVVAHRRERRSLIRKRDGEAYYKIRGEIGIEDFDRAEVYK
jgi:hypothetical protein